MISTVTTSTVSTISINGSFAVICILILLFLLVQKELVNASGSERTRRLRKLLNVGIVPLLFAFSLIVIIKVMDVLK